MAEHRITRIRRETRRRRLSVLSVEPLGSAMLRVWLTGDELADFASDAPDDHVKLFLPAADGGSVARDYTPRHFDAARQTLAIDFALYGTGEETGPATRWAMTAAPGDVLEIGGPRGSTVIADDFDWYLLVGDETAVPAIGRRLEELGAIAPVHVLLFAAPSATLPPLPGAASIDRVDRPADDDPTALASRAAAWPAPAGDGFVWIAAEASAARAVRDAVLARGHPREWIRASGYWQTGAAGTHAKIDA